MAGCLRGVLSFGAANCLRNAICECPIIFNEHGICISMTWQRVDFFEAGWNRRLAGFFSPAAGELDGRDGVLVVGEWVC